MVVPDAAAGRALAADQLKLVANASNRALLALLAAGPSYPRALASRLGLTEGEVQRKLHRLERAGLVEGAWRHRGKTVKEYVLRATGLELRFEAGAVRLDGVRTEA